MLQLTLLKMALLVGTEVYIRETFKKLVPPEKQGEKWKVITESKCEDGSTYIHQEHYDAVICATGKKVPIKGEKFHILRYFLGRPLSKKTRYKSLFT